MRAAGQETSPSGNLGDLDNNYLTFPRNVRFTITCDGADEFTKAARLAARDGVDTLKVNVSGDRDWGHMHADDTVTVIAARELAAVMEVANARASWWQDAAVRVPRLFRKEDGACLKPAAGQSSSTNARISPLPSTGLDTNMGLDWPPEPSEYISASVEIARAFVSIA